jgi:3D (Asp-Asp-Asp) domain-containing protein
MSNHSMKKLFPESLKNSKVIITVLSLMIAFVVATVFSTATNEQAKQESKVQQDKASTDYANRFAGEKISTVSKTVKTKAHLNARTGAGVKYKVKYKIPKGKKVTYVGGRKGDWVKVSYKGKKGYVNAKYLSGITRTGSAGRTFYVSSTAYTAYCAGCSGRTATGINLRANPSKKVIAVDPRVIPLGKKVYVEGYGLAVAGDTGGAIKGNKIDVFMSSKSQALSWGRRTVKVTVY